MGLALWHFVRWPDAATLTPLTRKRADAIFGGEEHMSQYAEQYLHIADVLTCGRLRGSRYRAPTPSDARFTETDGGERGVAEELSGA